jgi:dihydrofolate reductase
MDAEMDDYFRKFADEIDTVLYGRVSYERYGNYQPGPDRSGTEIDFYRAVNRMRKYVFSTTLQAVEGDATLVREDVAAQVQGLKREPGKDIWLFGGASLVTTFVRLDLIDEYRIGLHPVALGVGKPLFGALTGRLSLELVRSETYQSGLVGLWYRPRRG